MPQLLLELLTEEIPARMQAKAQADLERASAFGFRCGQYQKRLSRSKELCILGSR